MYVWDKIHKTNELKYLFKGKVNLENNDNLVSLWSSIYNEYLDEFGINDNYLEILKIKREIALKQAEYLLKSDRIMLTYIALEREKLKDLVKPSEKPSDYRKNIIDIEKIQGVKITPLEITALEYFTYLKNLKNG